MKTIFFLLAFLFIGCQNTNVIEPTITYEKDIPDLIANCDITNFTHVSSNQITFDLFVQVTDTNFKMGSSTFTFSGLISAQKIELIDVNPKYTLGSYNYYKMYGRLYEDFATVQILSLDPLGGSKVSGEYEKICKVIITYATLPTINWVIGRTFVFNTTMTQYPYLQLNGGFFRPTKKSL